MSETQQDEDRHLRSCGWDLQFLGALGVFASGLHLATGLSTGEWGTFIGHRYPPVVSCILGAICFLLSTLNIFLGYRVKKGDCWALSVAVVILWGFTCVAALSLTTVGAGWYELIFFGMMATFFSMMLLAIRRRLPPDK